jgi:predicted nucleic acid-binding protein
VTVVLDASVVLKWLLADPVREPDTARATALVRAVVAGEVEILQPVHWLVEVAAVLARLSPESASADVLMLRAMEIPATDEGEVLRRACMLAIDTGQHLFDTLYHAVALETEDAVLVTADDRYYKRALRFGRLLPLRDWEGPGRLPA